MVRNKQSNLIASVKCKTYCRCHQQIYYKLEKKGGREEGGYLVLVNYQSFF